MGVQWEVTGLFAESRQRSRAQRESSLVGGPRPPGLGMAVAGQESAGRTLILVYRGAPSEEAAGQWERPPAASASTPHSRSRDEGARMTRSMP